MVVDTIDAEPDDLDLALVELGLDFGHVAELRRANRCEVLRVRKQHRPRIADPIVETHRTFSCLRFKIRSGIANLQGHRSSPLDVMCCLFPGWIARRALPAASPGVVAALDALRLAHAGHQRHYRRTPSRAATTWNKYPRAAVRPVTNATSVVRRRVATTARFWFWS